MSEQQNLKELSNFIDSNPEPREQKRALAIMMWIEGVPCSKIQRTLNVSPAFISQCKAKFIKNGIEDLRLKYQGSKAYLNQWQRTEIIKYLDAKEFVSLQELRYYQLFDEAEISWKKTQKKNSQKNDKLVETHKIEIEKILQKNREEIEAGRLVVYMIYECHLLWGDVCGYVWGKTKIRVEVPMTNQKERQTYFGALNSQTKQFFVREYGTGNSENTVLFIKYLQSLNRGARIF